VELYSPLQRIITSLVLPKNLRNWQINQPLFDGRGRWIKEMTEDDKVIFKDKAQKYLEKFGYADANSW